MRRAAAVAAVLAMPPAGRAQAQPAAGAPPRDNLAVPAGVLHAAPATLGAVDVVGTGPVPLILIPGAPLGGDVWRDFATRNASRYTSYLVTLPGYAGTAAPPVEERTPRPWSDGVEQALTRLVHERSLARPILVANHLMAAYYAVRANARLGCASGGVIALGSEPVAGDPFSFTGTLTAEQRRRGLAERWLPFFRSVSPEQWAQGTIPAARLSADPERGERLRRAAIDTPLWIQLRYYVEYLSDDVTSSVTGSRTPILAVNPRFALQGFAPPLVDAMARRYGSREAAEDSLTVATSWPRRHGIRAPSLEERQLEVSTLVMMDDAPAAVDALVAEFVARHRPAGARRAAGAARSADGCG